MKENTCDKAIAILQATSDGDKLTPLDLKLVENAVNGFPISWGDHVKEICITTFLIFFRRSASGHAAAVSG